MVLITEPREKPGVTKRDISITLLTKHTGTILGSGQYESKKLESAYVTITRDYSLNLFSLVCAFAVQTIAACFRSKPF